MIDDKRNLIKNPVVHFAYKDLRSHKEKINLDTLIAVHKLFNKNTQISCLTISYSSFIKPFKTYFLKKISLDVKEGLTLSAISSYYDFL